MPGAPSQPQGIPGPGRFLPPPGGKPPGVQLEGQPGDTAGSHLLSPFSAAPPGLAAHSPHSGGLITKWNHVLPPCGQVRLAAGPGDRRFLLGCATDPRAGRGALLAGKPRTPGAPGVPQSEGGVLSPPF